MNDNAFDLSIEELAYAMGVLGGSEVATGYLMALLGERPQREMQGRLLAASHGLVARGYLDFDPVTGDKRLSPDLARTVGVLIQHDFLLRCTRAAAGQEKIVSFYIHGDQCVEHRLDKAVVAHVETLPDRGEIVHRSAAFFDLLSEDHPVEGVQSVGIISATLFEKIGQSSLNADARRIATQLTDGGLPADVSRAMAADLSDLAYRGSVMKVKTQEGALVSDAAFLIFKGPHGYWILEVVADEPPNLRVFAGRLDQFHRSIQALTA